MDGMFEAVPLQCFACAATEAEARSAQERVNDGGLGRGALDGIKYAAVEVTSE